jgi:hypothetical protein
VAARGGLASWRIREEMAWGARMSTAATRA